MTGKGYFMIWGIVEFKAFQYFFCWTPPALFEVTQMVEFLCMYLTLSLLCDEG